MDVVRISDALIEINGCVRVDRGPLLKTAIASSELFASGVLADHYQIGGLDKLGAVIVEGQEFSYLDWRGDHVWHVYALTTEEEDLEGGGTGMVERWRRRDWRATEAEASIVAAGIAHEMGA